ncbi:MAG: hypothetical protein Q9207_002777, partial [Kuettlingeria erythrocarpa]
DLPLPLASIEYTGPIQFPQLISSLQGSISAPTPPSSNSSVLPLTSANLRKLHQEKGTMADCSTPNKSSGISKGTTSSLAGEVGYVRETLHLKGLHMDDRAAREEFDEYINEARDLLTRPRHSTTSKQLLQGIDKTRLDYADRNETTFTNRFFGVFQSQSRHVQRAAHGSHGPGDNDDKNIEQEDLPVPIGWAARDWADDGLDASYNRVFQAGSVSNIDALDEDQKAILGTSIKNHYTDEERAVIAQHKGITQISLGLACPFFDIEVKTHGDFGEAANQANPGGAAMVDAHRELEILARLATSKANAVKAASAAKAANVPKASATNAPSANTANAIKANTTPTTTISKVATTNTASKASNKNSKAFTADFSTKAYSMVLQPQYAQINVHWVQVGRGEREGEESLTYHMHCVASYALNQEEQLKACRAAVNNILDWGLGERNTAIKALLNQIHNSSKALNAATVKGKGKAKAVDKSPASKKRRVDNVDNDDDVVD